MGCKKDKSLNTEDTVFVGSKIPKEYHQRLYRAKAQLELLNGEFYGMGRLITKIFKIGISKIEQEIEKLKRK